LRLGTVAILGGGLATRLRPATKTLPKALLPVAGRPFVEHQLALLRNQGCRRAVLCVGYLGETIRHHLGDGARWGVALEYSYDGPVLLGTGGALRRALPLLGEEFFVLYGDTYLPCDFRAVEAAFRASRLPALMTVLRNEGRWDRSNVSFAEGRVLHYDKRSPASDALYIDYGLSVLRPEVLSGRDDGEAFDLGEVFADLARRRLLAGFEVHERFYEIGSPEGLAEAEPYLSRCSAILATGRPAGAS
jgi:NDP-sugar pyrophosphorylase family protein